MWDLTWPRCLRVGFPSRAGSEPGFPALGRGLKGRRLGRRESELQRRERGEKGEIREKGEAIRKKRGRIEEKGERIRKKRERELEKERGIGRREENWKDGREN